VTRVRTSTHQPTLFPTPHTPHPAPQTNAFLYAGELSVCDAGARTLWQLVKDNKRLLSPSKDALGLPGTQVRGLKGGGLCVGGWGGLLVEEGAAVIQQGRPWAAGDTGEGA
jgi:hypothetical protein